MNRAQELMLLTYGEGDYSFLIGKTYAEAEEYLAYEGGDTLALFLFRELTDAQGPEAKQIALEYLNGALKDITALMNVLSQRLDAPEDE